MKYLLLGLIAFALLQSFVIYTQAENNKQLIYDLNVSQTAFKIQSNQIAKGLCLPVLEIR